MPDAIQAAMLGLTSEAKKYTVYAMTNKEPTLKFPAFWREQNDYQPSEDNGGVAQDALQKMIMQTDGSKIMLMTAWPAGWNANFQLNAPFNTVVQGTIINGILTNLVVTPSSRLANVAFMNGQAFPPSQIWGGTDIGSVGLTGNTSQSGDVITVNGSGADILWHGGRLSVCPATGDWRLRHSRRWLIRLSDTDPWAKAGVMIRETLIPDQKISPW